MKYKQERETQILGMILLYTPFYYALAWKFIKVPYQKVKSLEVNSGCRAGTAFVRGSGSDKHQIADFKRKSISPLNESGLAFWFWPCGPGSQSRNVFQIQVKGSCLLLKSDDQRDVKSWSLNKIAYPAKFRKEEQRKPVRQADRKVFY
jgi:hypothetical protein